MFKRCNNKAAYSLVGIDRNCDTMSWKGNVIEPISSIVFSDPIDSL